MFIWFKADLPRQCNRVRFGNCLAKDFVKFSLIVAYLLPLILNGWL